MKAQPGRNEGSPFSLLVIAFAVLVIGFGSTWAYLEYTQRQQRLQRSSSFTALKPVTAGHGTHSVAATFVVKTSEANLGWARRNRDGIEAALQQMLVGVDVQQTLAPGGLEKLQQDMQLMLDATFGSDKVQQVIVTDFLASEH